MGIRAKKTIKKPIPTRAPNYGDEYTDQSWRKSDAHPPMRERESDSDAVRKPLISRSDGSIDLKADVKRKNIKWRQITPHWFGVRVSSDKTIKPNKCVLLRNRFLWSPIVDRWKHPFDSSFSVKTTTESFRGVMQAPFVVSLFPFSSCSLSDEHLIDQNKCYDSYR